MSQSRSQPSRWLRIFLPSIIVIVWLTLAGIGGPYFGRIGEVSSNDQTTFLPASSESTQVQAQLSKFRDDRTLPAIILFERDVQLSATDKDSIGKVALSFANLDGIVDGVSPPLVSDDGKAGYIVVPIDSTSGTAEVTESLQRILDEEAPKEVKHYVTGPAGFSNDLKTAFSGIDGMLLLTALGAVFVILLVVYRSPLLPFIVLFTSLFALCVSILSVWWLAHAGVVTLNGQVQGILFILVIGAATDYSLLYVARYREELHHHRSLWEATKVAWKGSLEPIVASGGTVIVGLLCLLLSDLNSNKALGPVGAIGIALSITSALTLLPSLLLLIGRSAFWPLRPVYAAQPPTINQHSKGLWPRIARFVAGRPRVIWLTTALLLIALAGFATQFKASGVPQSDLILGSSQARDGQKRLGVHFPEGSGSPAVIIAAANKQTQLLDALAIDGVTSVSALSRDSPSGQVPLGADAPKFGPLAAATPTVVEGKIALQATLSDAPDSNAAEQTITAIRSAVHKVDEAAIVGGVTATALDTNTASIHDRNVIIPTVLVIITLLLMLLLRSILIPLLLMLTTVVSFATALGVSALVFNGIFGFPGADPSVPLYAFVFLVALGIDYNIFLMTRVREESLKHGTKDGILRGLIVTGGIITSAGIVLAATFAALAVIPILFLAQLAFIVAFGVLLDALLVRSLLVPALVRDVGSVVWWPSKLRHKK